MLRDDVLPSGQLDTTDSSGLKSPDHHDVKVSARLLPDGAEKEFEADKEAALRKVLKEGARRLDVQLLPPSRKNPFDLLHNISKDGEVGPAIEDLDQPLGDYLKQKKTTRDFGIELVLVFRVNARWAVATQAHMTPREILALPAINLDPTDYSLYLAGSADLLPPDVPVKIERGQVFEAQRDGKYGA